MGMSNFLPTLRWGTTQKVSISGSSAATSNAVGSGIQQVRLMSTVACYIKVAGTPTATTSDPLLAPYVPEYIEIKPGEKVAAITDGASGSLFVTECSK